MAHSATSRAAIRPRPRVRFGEGIRWDRLARFGLLAVLGIIVLLYISPIVHWIQQSGTAGHERAQVKSLQAEHDALLTRLHQLRRPGAVEQEARKLGMVAPGERPYVVEGIPGGR
jgi:cell division protein FtsB